MPYFVIGTVQFEAARHSQGFEDKNVGSSPGLLGQYVATVAAHQPGELPKSSSSKPSERSDARGCISEAYHSNISKVSSQVEMILTLIFDS